MCIKGYVCENDIYEFIYISVQVLTVLLCFHLWLWAQVLHQVQYTVFIPSLIFSISASIYLSISITKKLQLLIKIPLLLPLVVLLSDWSFSVKILQLLIYFLLGHSLKTILTTCFIGLYIAWQMETAAYPDAGSILNWQIDEGRYDI